MSRRSHHTVPALFRRCCLALLLVLATTVSVAQSREYGVKSVFLYNFGQFVDWPPSAFSGPDAPFVIGVLGNDPFGRLLEEAVQGELIAGRPILVHRYASVRDVRSCHVLFIGSGAREALAALRGRPILTVGESNDFVEDGGMIQFFTEQNRVRFLIRPAAAKAVKLNISSKLLRLAKIYE